MNLCERLANRWRCSPREVPAVIAGAVFGLIGWGGVAVIVVLGAGHTVTGASIDPGQVLPALVPFL